jgi:hypothetical protein
MAVFTVQCPVGASQREAGRLVSLNHAAAIDEVSFGVAPAAIGAELATVNIGMAGNAFLRRLFKPQCLVTGDALDLGVHTP